MVRIAPAAASPAYRPRHAAPALPPADPAYGDTREDLVTPQPGNRIEYVWKDNRLLEARGFAEKAKKPPEIGTYKYDCPDHAAPP